MISKVGKITTGFQITIPVQYREKYNIHVGDYIRIKEESNRLVLETVENDKKSKASQALDEIFANIKANKIDDEFANMTEDEVMDTVIKEIKDMRREQEEKKNS